MAHSNNAFFEELGRRMGFDTVANYARMLGLGQLSGFEISEEKPGSVPTESPKRGGVARMSSFGEGILMTPLQLEALVSSVASGGTLYYLQYPRTLEEKEAFEPRVKRTLDIQSALPDLRDGMHAAVLHRDAGCRRAKDHHSHSFSPARRSQRQQDHADRHRFGTECAHLL